MNRSVSTALDNGGFGALAPYWALLKPRVMSLVVLTGLTGIVMAPDDIHPVAAFTALLCIAVGAGASGVLNMWFDSDIDGLMQRTAMRPIPRGHVEPSEALGFGVVLACGSVMVMGVLVNWVAATLLAFTIGFYVFVYTMWLKRRTPQNIVIGGAAGAFPPMIGWAAVTGSVSLEAVVLFLIIFLWTPPHFWALALYRARDYEAAGVPMLPVVAGSNHTRSQILLYSVLFVAASLLPIVLSMAGIGYTIAAPLLGAAFLMAAWRVYRDREGQAATRASKRLFAYSIAVLFGLFTVLLVEALIGLPAITRVV